MELFFRFPVSMNDVKLWRIGYFNGDEVTQNFECNHKEVETRMVLHVALSSEDAVVVAAVFDFDNLCLFKMHD